MTRKGHQAERDPVPPQPVISARADRLAPLRKGDRVRAVSRNWEGVLLDPRPRTDGCFLVALGGGEFWWDGHDLERIGCSYCEGIGQVTRVHVGSGSCVTRSCPACGG